MFNQDIQVELSDHLVDRIKKLNSEFLVLVSDIAKQDISAAITLGLKPEVVEMLAGLSHRSVLKLSDCGILLAKLRFDDITFWQDVFNPDSDTDANDILHKILTERH